ncbi:MAG: hypothetical protein LBE13_17765 [Bacteroidales bacterium]|jgi:hypothetical protein|nr:hypothetical protein [Bacteroidales bacterium]
MKKFVKKICKIIWYSLICPKIVIPQATKKTCFVFGNGPSLSTDIQNKIEFLQNQDVFVVNHFAQTELFCLIKPTFYVFADPMFWGKTKNDKTKEKVRNTFNAMNKKVDWNITLFVPTQAASIISNIFKDNAYIKLQQFGTAEIGEYLGTYLKYKAYKKNVAIKAQTVANAAIFLAINMNYKEINVLGIEHNWFKDLVLQENNVLGIIDKHFYNKSDETIVDIINETTGESRKVHEELRMTANALESHHTINTYAKYRGVQIYNLTTTTFVDAYSRKKFI